MSVAEGDDLDALARDRGWDTNEYHDSDWEDHIPEDSGDSTSFEDSVDRITGRFND